MSGAGFIAVGLGAALGAWMRWWLGLALNAATPHLPLGTLAANLIGGYLIGVAVEVFSQHGGLSQEMKLFVITGFLGGLTTFSSFSGESLILLQRGQFALALVHTAAHLFGSLACAGLGFWLLRGALR